jgi:hypothetical protein
MLTLMTIGSSRSALPTRLSGPATIRPFVEDDIPHVARLHHRVLRPADGNAGARLEAHDAYFARVFFGDPSHDDALSSLVYEDRDGRIVGFLGVIPRRMSFQGRPVRAAISSQFVVDPVSHVGLVAVALAKAFLAGPQDLSITDEADDLARRTWEGLGGTTALLHSMHWTRPLRPARLALSFLRKRRRLTPLALLASPVARIVDALVPRLSSRALHHSVPRHAAEELSEATVLAHLPEFAGLRSLRPEYDARTLAWMLDLAQRRKPGGRLRMIAVKDGSQLMGWYLYHLAGDGIAEALQIAATPATLDAVLDHLFHHAWRAGAIAVNGRLEPRFVQSLSEKLCLFHRRGPWMLVKARDPELVRSFETGDAFFSRVDGEWSLGLPIAVTR